MPALPQRAAALHRRALMHKPARKLQRGNKMQVTAKLPLRICTGCPTRAAGAAGCLNPKP